MKNVVLSTDRLNLRQMGRDDVPLLQQIFADPVAMKYYPSIKNNQETMEWIEWTLRNYEECGVGLWIVEDRITGEFLGQCGIVPQIVEGAKEMEIGYLFARRVWGNGYATEAATACKHYGLKQMELRKIVSLPDANNKPSARVAERIGMTLEKRIFKWNKEVLVYSVYADTEEVVER
ncbi:GNAT family N-acetyltransferase [Paenibacillus sp. XY044]|uniref:GNAT family N-acetyltransferase n=1 Tax=Paenibacillus sp. XY044 TaxID=2026089 RepID=UPI000B985077|nr:GNAT family N-acetyltransferase [Paenibacillus sp. XY044]OZB98446.1 GNAT family N-acetyltransferase [Paenibacillus sp. XY044]